MNLKFQVIPAKFVELNNKKYPKRWISSSENTKTSQLPQNTPEINIYSLEKQVSSCFLFGAIVMQVKYITC